MGREAILQGKAWKRLVICPRAVLSSPIRKRQAAQQYFQFYCSMLAGLWLSPRVLYRHPGLPGKAVLGVALSWFAVIVLLLHTVSGSFPCWA